MLPMQNVYSYEPPNLALRENTMSIGVDAESPWNQMGDDRLYREYLKELEMQSNQEKIKKGMANTAT